MYKEMLNKLESIKGKFVNEKTIDDIFKKEHWECMGFNKGNNRITYIESPMGKYIKLEIELDRPAIDWGELAPGTKIKIKSIKKMCWED